MALKLDMSKAYDMIEWVWLEKVMEKLGFANRMRDLIMRSVSTITYSIKINGTSRGHITPYRESVKETLCHLTFSSCVQKACLL